MSELPTSRPDIDALAFAFGGSAYTKTQMSYALRESGYAPDAIPGSEHWNDLLDRLHDFLEHLEATPRVFTQLNEAIAAVEEGEVFRVRVDTNMPVRGTRALYQNAPQATVAIVKIVTDGQYLAVAQDDDIFLLDETGAQLDTCEVEGGAPITDLAMAGAGLIVASTDLHGYSVDGGALVLVDSYTALAATIGLLATNGLTVLFSAGAILYTIEWDDGFGPLTSSLTPSTNNPNAICMDHIYGFVCYRESSANMATVQAFTLSSLSMLWTKDLGFAATQYPRGICTDGERVYCCTDRGSLSAGGYASVFCIERLSGAILWTYDTGYNADGIVVDDRFVYVSHQSSLAPMVFDKHTGARVAYLYFTDQATLFDADGVSVWSKSYSTPNHKIQRHWVGDSTRFFVKDNGLNEARRPFHKLALPVR